MGFAGCSGGVTLLPFDASGPDSVHGALRGLVTDDEQRPLGSVQVGAVVGPTLFLATTDDSGTFAVKDLLPGRYTLMAERIGFEDAIARLEIPVGITTTVTIPMTGIPVDEPRIDRRQYNGEYGVGAAFILTTLCQGCNEAEKAWFMFGGFPKDMVGLVAEARWESSETLQFDLVARKSGDLLAAERFWLQERSQSPWRVFLQACAAYEGPGYAWDTLPCDESESKPYRGSSSTDAHLETWYVGRLEKEARTLDPVCAVVYEGCMGVGATSGLRWDTWISFFIHGLPLDVEAYTAYGDG